MLSDRAPINRYADLQVDSASQFDSAARHDLADNERIEASIIENILPPLLTDDKIDETLRKIIRESDIPNDSKRATGIVLKSFYQVVDPSDVDGNIVRQKLQQQLATKLTLS